MLQEELARILKGDRDHVDEQFDKNRGLIVGRAFHNMVTQRRFAVPDKSRVVVANTILWAYYRSIYYRSSDFGSLVLVLPDTQLVDLVAMLFGAVLGLRDQEHAITDAAKLCPAMRDSKEAAPFIATRLITGLPFDGLMSWDISNLCASCSLTESIFFTTKNPSTWSVTATKKGEVNRIEQMVDEVFDFKAAIAEIKRT